MKFAYMIMAHNEPYVLDKLLQMLDYSENDIYIHVDKKSKIINKNELHTNSARLVIIPSQDVMWGGESQIYVIFNLLKEALKSKHDYYHLISGVDLPLKCNSDMVKFFEENYGKQFIGITPGWAESSLIEQRYKLHWFFQDKIGKKRNILHLISRIITRTEKYIGFKRGKGENIHFYGGPTWFSITEKAANYILAHEEWVNQRFENTICCDEIYAQTIIGNSEFVQEIYDFESGNAFAECLRYARFNGVSPFVLNVKDYDVLMKSKCLFARKFGTETDEEQELVDKIFSQFK